MHNTTTKLYGLPIYVGSCLGTQISVTHKYITMDQDIYDLFIIAVAEVEGFSSYWIDNQLTRPRDDLFKSLANKEFYLKLIGIVYDLKKNNMTLRKQRSEAEMLNKIKICPWCDTLPDIAETLGGETTLLCLNADCKVKPHTKQPTKLEAILAWNCRNRSLELTADYCSYYEQELIPQLKAKATKHLRLAGHWSSSYTVVHEKLGVLDNFRNLVREYFDINKIGCECCNVSDCGECIVCLILKYAGD